MTNIHETQTSPQPTKEQPPTVNTLLGPDHPYFTDRPDLIEAYGSMTLEELETVHKKAYNLKDMDTFVTIVQLKQQLGDLEE